MCTLHNNYLEYVCFYVRLHSELADLTKFQLVGVGVDFVFPLSQEQEQEQEQQEQQEPSPSECPLHR